MKRIVLKAPAKINLYLKLTGKRSDGFNNLVTVFYRIALADVLTFERIERGFQLIAGEKGVPTGRANLIAKTYEMLQAYRPFPGGVRIKLEKNIPVKAGLGGASSDAATTLIGLNKLFHLNLSKAILMKIGARLGSDVPFFVAGDRLALGIDRGEKIIPLDQGMGKVDIGLFVFKEGLLTKDVYQNHHYTGAGINLTKILHEVIMLPIFLKKKDVSAIAKISYNDLLRSANSLKPEVFSLITRLKNLGLPMVQMTGSGATVFCLLPRKKLDRLFLAQFSSKRNVSFILTRSG